MAQNKKSKQTQASPRGTATKEKNQRHPNVTKFTPLGTSGRPCSIGIATVEGIPCNCSYAYNHNNIISRVGTGFNECQGNGEGGKKERIQLVVHIVMLWVLNSTKPTGHGNKFGSN